MVWSPPAKQTRPWCFFTFRVAQPFQFPSAASGEGKETEGDDAEAEKNRRSLWWESNPRVLPRHDDVPSGTLRFRTGESDIWLCRKNKSGCSMHLLDGFVIHQRSIRGATEDSPQHDSTFHFLGGSHWLWEKKKCCLERTTLIENASMCGQNHEKATIKATRHF